MKKYFIFIAFNVCFASSLCGMDNKQLPHFTPEEEVFNVMATHCPEAMRIIAHGIIAQHPRISWQQFRDSYVARHDGLPPFANATRIVLHAIWRELNAIHFEELRKIFLDSQCVFRPLPKELMHVIKSLQEAPQNSQPHEVKAIILIDPELGSESPSIMQEAKRRARIYSDYVGWLLNLNFRIDSDSATDILYTWCNPASALAWKSALPLIFDRFEYQIFINQGSYEKLDQLLNSKHLIIISTFNSEILNLLHNKDGIVVIKAEERTLKDRLVTLEDMAKKWHCPAEIIQNLDAINNTIPREYEISQINRPPSFETLNRCMAGATKLFLENGKFDINHALPFFKVDNIE